MLDDLDLQGDLNREHDAEEDKDNHNAGKNDDDNGEGDDFVILTNNREVKSNGDASKENFSSYFPTKNDINNNANDGDDAGVISEEASVENEIFEFDSAAEKKPVQKLGFRPNLRNDRFAENGLSGASHTAATDLIQQRGGEQEQEAAVDPEKLAYILIGVCCGLSILCLIVVAISIGWKSETHYRYADTQ